MSTESYTVEPPISGHSKRRTPLISGQNIFPRPFPSQILIKKSPKGGHSISGHLHLADKNFCTEWSKTCFFSLQLADTKGDLVSDIKKQVISDFKLFISTIFVFFSKFCLQRFSFSLIQLTGFPGPVKQLHFFR